jgi:enoyl-CoA hydratase
LSETKDILAETKNGVLHIVFNRPQARNAFTFEMYERLATLCREADTDPEIRVILLTGAGDKAFAAGTDISQFRAFSGPQDAVEYEARVSRVLDTIETCGKPIIASIAGACTGGGAGIAAAADIRIASANVRFGFPIARTLGNCLSMSNYARLASLIGSARTTELIFTARLVEADEAKAIGLVSEILPDVESLAGRGEELARIIAGNAPLTLRATKEALRRLRPRLAAAEGQDLLLLCYMSQDFREGMEAFLNKRAPHWTGC